MEKKIDIKRLIAALPDDEADRQLMDYVRASNEMDLHRDVVRDIEREIKFMVGNVDNINPKFRHLSSDEYEKLWILLLNRNTILDSMMVHPTTEEIARLRYQNGRLYRLTQDVYEKARHLCKLLHHSPCKVDDNFAYDLNGTMTFAYNDNAVKKLNNEAYYGSDFPYMLHLQAWYKTYGHTTYWLEACTNVFTNSLCNEDEAMKNMDAAYLDDGTSWNEGVFRNPAFDDIDICHAIHGLLDHQGYSGPDILRMDNFVIRIKLEYERDSH